MISCDKATFISNYVVQVAIQCVSHAVCLCTYSTCMYNYNYVIMYSYKMYMQYNHVTT